MSNQQSPYRPYPGSPQDDRDKRRDELERRQLEEIKRREASANVRGCLSALFLIGIVIYFIVQYLNIS